MTPPTSLEIDGTSTLTSTESLIASAGITGEGLLAERNEPVQWLQQCIINIWKLRDLPANWDSYGAKPVNPDSIQFAMEVMNALSSITGVSCPRIAASPAGNVALSWDLEDYTRELDVELDPNRVIRYAYIDEENSTKDCEGVAKNLDVIAQFLTQW
ncbi:hypothetical protein [Gimesia sp.]|uniref:hypothetical protein n=1 Tax=Gimesia sp. TaxID=2024833 RepID=UPI0032EC0FFA